MGAKEKVPVALLLIVLGAFQLLSGIVLYLSPHGRRTGELVVFGMLKRDWTFYHTWVGFALAVLAIVHLALNWRQFMGELKIAFRK